MARKISDRERLMTFILTATPEQLREAKELIDTAIRVANPKKRSTKSGHVRKAIGLAEVNPPPAD